MMAASSPLVNQAQFSDDELSNIEITNDEFDAQDVFEIDEVRTILLVPS